MSYMHIDHTKCIGCGECVENCPFDAAKLTPSDDHSGNKAVIGAECCLCSTCEMVCEQDAVQLVSGSGNRTIKLAEDFHF